MTDSRADELLRQHEAMKGTRSMWESHWQECAERVMPVAADFTSKRSEGEKRTERVFDSTAILANERFAAAMNSMLTPANQKWHKLKAPEPLSENIKVKRYLEEVTNILFRVRRSPRANFANNMQEAYMSLGGFGTGVVFVDDELGRGITYSARHLGECYIAENAVGRVDVMHREFEFTARQAAQMYGEDKLTEAMRNALAKGDVSRKFVFVHCVKPNEDRVAGRLDYRGMAFASYHIATEGRAIMRESGYRTFPFAVSRYVKSPRELYGRSPAMTALADIKTLNEMEKTTLRAAHRVVDPPLLLADDGAMSGFSTRPGALNFGTVGPDGRPLAMPLQTGANIPLSLEMSDQRRRAINDTFLVTLFQILVETPQMTATEAMLRAQEKGALLAPTMGRQQSELLGPIIEREIDILAAAGVLPPMPDELREYGGEISVEYDSPMSRLERAEEAAGILRTIEGLAPLAQINPRAVRRLNPDECAKVLAEANGVPASCIYSDEELDALSDEQAQADQASQAVAAAPAMAKATLDIAKAQAIAEAPAPAAA